MKRLLICLVMVAMTTGVAAQDWPSSSTLTQRFVEPVAASHDLLQAIGDHKGGALSGDAPGSKGGPTCGVANIACNSTVNSTLTDQDCALEDGTFVDFWVFDGVAGETVTINLSSDDFDTFLALLDPTPEVVNVDDDGGGGTNSRIVHNIDSTGEWAIAVNNFAPGDLGDYTLQLACTGCVEDATTICLNNNRFQVSVDWSAPDFPERPAFVSDLRTNDSGVFYFLDPQNLEFLIKVLDGCDITGHFWVFFAATTNVEFEVTVTDTQTGNVQRYTNPLGQPADAVTDTSAFATCP